MKKASWPGQKLPLTSIDVCLISMPFADVFLPSMALGLLQSVMAEAGIRVRSIYANLLFAEQLGIDQWNRINLKDQRFPLDQWAFASTAFPDYKPDEDLFIHEVYPIGKARWQSKEEFKDELRFVREQAEQLTTSLAQYVIDLSPKVVGCTSGLFQRVPALAILRKIRELNPDIITVMGGGDCDTDTGKIAHETFSWIDYVVSGEAEDVIVPLMQGLFTYGRELTDLPKGVLGPIHREIGYPSPVPRIVAHSFSEQIMPCYKDYFQTLEVLPTLKKTIRPSLPIQASRGCWYGKCKFCALNPKDVPYRVRRGGDVLAELKSLSEEYHVEHFVFLDNMLDMRCFDDLFPRLIDLGAPYTIFCLVSSNTSKEQLAMLRHAGAFFCQPGLESFHSAVLEAMNKGNKVWKNVELLKWGRQFGIHIFWIFLHGIPGEKDTWYGEMADLIPLLEHLNPPLAIGTIDYERGSHYFQNACDYSLELIHAPGQEFIYPLESAVLNQYLYLLYDKGKQKDGIKEPLLHKPGLEKLQSVIKVWQRNFKKEDKPVLSMIVSGKEVYIRDTRSIATAPHHSLAGLERDIFLACTVAQEGKSLKERYLQQGMASSDFDAAINALLTNWLMMQIDGFYLALAVEEPLMEYMDLRENPLGIHS